MSGVLLNQAPPTTQAQPQIDAIPGGFGDLRAILSSEGPVVKAVLLRADGTSEELPVDTTPSAKAVPSILGGPFTFLGQYEDEGIVLMVRRDTEGLPLNAHELQPPFRATEVRGDVLCLRVAPEDDTASTTATVPHSKPNEEFFLDYTREEWQRFAARTDVVASLPPMEGADEEGETMDEGEASEEESEDEEAEGEDDSEDDDDDEDADQEGGFLALLMGQVLQRFQQEHGRAPEAHELEALRSAIAQKLGGVAEETTE